MKEELLLGMAVTDTQHPLYAISMRGGSGSERRNYGTVRDRDRDGNGGGGGHGGDLVFAKLKGYSIWPAKITKLNKEQYHVRLYGNPKTGIVTVDNLFAYVEHKEKFATDKLLRRKNFRNGIAEIENDLIQNTLNVKFSKTVSFTDSGQGQKKAPKRRVETRKTTSIHIKKAKDVPLPEDGPGQNKAPKRRIVKDIIHEIEVESVKNVSERKKHNPETKKTTSIRKTKKAKDVPLPEDGQGQKKAPKRRLVEDIIHEIEVESVKNVSERKKHNPETKKTTSIRKTKKAKDMPLPKDGQGQTEAPKRRIVKDIIHEIEVESVKNVSERKKPNPETKKTTSIRKTKKAKDVPLPEDGQGQKKAPKRRLVEDIIHEIEVESVKNVSERKKHNPETKKTTSIRKTKKAKDVPLPEDGQGQKKAPKRRLVEDIIHEIEVESVKNVSERKKHNPETKKTTSIRKTKKAKDVPLPEDGQGQKKAPKRRLVEDIIHEIEVESVKNVSERKKHNPETKKTTSIRKTKKAKDVPLAHHGQGKKKAPKRRLVEDIIHEIEVESVKNVSERKKHNPETKKTTSIRKTKKAKDVPLADDRQGQNESSDGEIVEDIVHQIEVESLKNALHIKNIQVKKKPSVRKTKKAKSVPRDGQIEPPPENADILEFELDTSDNSFDINKKIPATKETSSIGETEKGEDVSLANDAESQNVTSHQQDPEDIILEIRSDSSENSFDFIEYIPDSKTTSSTIQNNLVLVYMPSAKCYGIDINYNKPKTLKTVDEKRAWMRKSLEKAMELKIKLESEQIKLNSIPEGLVSEPKRGEMTLEEANHFIEDLITENNALIMERDFIQTVQQLRDCLGFRGANVGKCLKILTDLKNIHISKLLLLRNPECVSVIRRVQKYQGNLKEWNMSHKNETDFKSKAALIRKLSVEIYNSFIELFTGPKSVEGYHFWNDFCEKVKIYKKFTSSNLAN
ncbi:uncharacterized protein Dwil_GK15060 [Drosophila willistoni]|uniref:PWWP domain-containing protein n=1 Tax=Drosophila willistoni TaxID=7260 RepID=B4MVH7_DROWI|nr:uncharacterized protein Dwil_GK15060 [Drosophila willistoni]